MNVELRPAVREDAEAIQAVAREAWHAAYGEFLDDDRIDRTVDAWYDPDRVVEDDIEASDRPLFVAVDTDAAPAAESAATPEGPDTDAAEGAGSATSEATVAETEPTDPETATAAILGFAEAAPDDEDCDLAHLYRIYVRPPAWGEGVGTALLDRIENTMWDRGFDRLKLSVFAANEVGVRFYQSRRFDRIATTHDETFDAEVYEYEKSL